MRIHRSSALVVIEGWYEAFTGEKCSGRTGMTTGQKLVCLRLNSLSERPCELVRRLRGDKDAVYCKGCNYRRRTAYGFQGIFHTAFRIVYAVMVLNTRYATE